MSCACGQEFEIGSGFQTVANFEDLNGLPADPSEILLLVRDPSGTETTYKYSLGQIIKDSNPPVGQFHKDISPLDQSGAWFIRWIGVGVVAKAAECVICVKPSAFTNPMGFLGT